MSKKKSIHCFDQYILLFVRTYPDLAKVFFFLDTHDILSSASKKYFSSNKNINIYIFQVSVSNIILLLPESLSLGMYSLSELLFIVSFVIFEQVASSIVCRVLSLLFSSDLDF